VRGCDGDRSGVPSLSPQSCDQGAGPGDLAFWVPETRSLLGKEPQRRCGVWRRPGARPAPRVSSGPCGPGLGDAGWPGPLSPSSGSLPITRASSPRLPLAVGSEHEESITHLTGVDSVPAEAKGVGVASLGRRLAFLQSLCNQLPAGQMSGGSREIVPFSAPDLVCVVCVRECGVRLKFPGP
jgi:hypothetical protein